MHSSRPRFESLKPGHSGLLIFIICFQHLRHLTLWHRRLIVHQIDRKPLRICQREKVSAARRIFHLLNLSRSREFRSPGSL